MHDLRYLGLALMGFFLALATGLLLGSALNSPDRKDRIYEGLRSQFDALRTDIQRVDDENKLLRVRVNSREQATRELLPTAVRNRLAGNTVAVVICGPLDERPFWGSLEETLRLAGAQLGTVVRVPDRLRSTSSETRRQLAQAWGGDNPTADPDPFDGAAWVARALHRGATPEQWQALEAGAGVDARSVVSTPTRLVLLLTAAQDEDRAASLGAADLPEFKFVDTARAEGMRVVAAEPEETHASVVDALSNRNIPTVDNVDTASGQVATVLALAGADGRFGSKPGAARAVPALESR